MLFCLLTTLFMVLHESHESSIKASAMIHSKFLLLCLVVSLVFSFLVTAMLIKRELWSCNTSREVPGPAHIPAHIPAAIHAELPSALPKYTPKKFDKFTQKMKEVTLQCKNVCSERADDICVPLDLAIFIYRGDLPAEQHTYDRQKPIVRLPLIDATKHLPKSMIVNECLVEDHFRDVQLLPHQGSCAIVGNSGILLGSGCGTAIDAHDFVIRANLAPISGFEKDVGHKANLSAFNTETLVWFSSSLLENPKPEYVQYKDRYLNHVHSLNDSIVWYLKHLRPPHDDMFRNVTNAIRHFKNSKARFAYSWKPISIEKKWNLSKRGTLGFDMFVVAQTFCTSISLYGFYPFHKDSKGKSIPHHYYEEMPEFSYQESSHDFSLEYKKLQELDAKGDLKHVVGVCKPHAEDHGHSS
ncbi:alpha-2,8-sialyltransferase 8B-like [Patiria miniata]|uniref:Uncharacterized protein n=1 Tax=Patiria miniata TaxID=46514 RepID=A0A914AL58_PATMI|nr:alpha-2,8-sialyltransferase 8B-like [Patiria miniata]